MSRKRILLTLLLTGGLSWFIYPPNVKAVPPCNYGSVSLNVSPNPALLNNNISFTISGDASTYIGDSWTGGVSNCNTSQWNNITCRASSIGNFTWTHTWKHCEGSFSNCSDTCTLSKNFAIGTYPPTPNITPNASCTSSDTSNLVTISWSATSPAVSYVDISTNSNFSSFYNKYVAGSTSTSASSGFNGYYGVSGPLTFQPNTTYYVRLWNGYFHSSTASFTTPSTCPTPTPIPTPTPTPTSAPLPTPTPTPSIPYTKLSFNQDLTQGDLTSTLKGNKDIIIHTTGNINISGVLNLPQFSKTGVIFADGNLNINSNITYGQNSSTGGLVFIVQGDVKIDKNVTEINAFIITYGQLCSAWDSNSCPSSVSASQLVINGSIVSLNPDKKPKFNRTLLSENKTKPAEKLNYEAKYLVILKDVFARDLTIWKEIK